MRNYEVLFILDPTLEEEKRNATIEMAKNVIRADGVVGKTDIWGMRKLAYPIQKKSEGFYVLITFQASPDLPKELDRRFRISDNVIRHMITSLGEDVEFVPEGEAEGEVPAEPAEEVATEVEEAAAESEEAAEVAAEEIPAEEEEASVEVPAEA